MTLAIPCHPVASLEHQSKGAISILQEYVQCSRQTRVGPLNRPILQWDFDTRMADYVSLQFRATVAFLLDGVPHHVAGGWHMSKKHAQRDAAERCLVLFVGRWGEHMARDEVSEDEPETVDAVEALEAFIGSCAMLVGSFPLWTTSWAEGQCQAQLELLVLGVPHKFAGTFCSTPEEARQDAARRTLWYLQCPGFEELFEVDPAAPAAIDRDIPAAPEQWLTSMALDIVGGDRDSAHLVAERKTVLMRTQNRLQQTFAKQLRPGQSVWEWTFEMRKEGSGWPLQCRAKVNLSVGGRIFLGDWARGQREAQLSACVRINAFLDGL